MGKIGRKIILETIYSRTLEDKILSILKSGNLDSYTMLEIAQELGDQCVQGSKGWDDLRLHLIDMEKRHLVEERHFGKKAGDWNRIVDYVPENPKVKWPK